MSEKHTEGRMTWRRRDDGSLIYIIGDPKTGPHAQGDIYISEDDLRRLVACWNACDGIATEQIERFGPSMLYNAGYVLAQRDELLAVASNFEISGPDDDGLVWLILHGNGTTGRAMFQLGKTDQIAVQVALHLEQDRRAAIAKVKGCAA